MGYYENICQVLGRRAWAWPLSLPSAYQMGGLGDGLFFGVDESLSCEENGRSKQESAGMFCSFWCLWLIQRVESRSLHRRRDSEGFIVDASDLPWNRI